MKEHPCQESNWGPLSKLTKVAKLPATILTILDFQSFHNFISKMAIYHCVASLPTVLEKENRKTAQNLVVAFNKQRHKNNKQSVT
jgi:hypothetical protein